MYQQKDALGPISVASSHCIYTLKPHVQCHMAAYVKVTGGDWVTFSLA